MVHKSERAWSNPDHFAVFELASKPPYYFSLKTIKKMKPTIKNPKKIVREMLESNIIKPNNPDELTKLFLGKKKELLEAVAGRRVKTNLFAINWGGISARTFILMPKILFLGRFEIGKNKPHAFTLLQHYAHNYGYVEKYSSMKKNIVKEFLGDRQGCIDDHLYNFFVFLDDIKRKDFSRVNISQLNAELKAWAGQDKCFDNAPTAKQDNI